ncbi:hypothetical protein CLAIMM_03953 [Cladophialophora immunda]|nr:hypothetical protein CLAIMM_03953 [Cladophialophora immunda]
MAMPPLQSPIMLATTMLTPHLFEAMPFESFPGSEDFDPIVEGICTNPKCQHQRNSIDCYGCDPVARTCCKCHSPLSSGTSARTFRPSSRASSIGSVATGPSVPPGSKKNWPDNLLADWPDTEKNDYVRTWALNGSDSIASPDRGGAISPLMGSPVESRRRLSLSGLLTLPVETDGTPDHIANLMEGPDPMDGKWTCKYNDCYKRFGRKENLKSHIQTHLGNRAYRCREPLSGNKFESYASASHATTQESSGFFEFEYLQPTFTGTSSVVAGLAASRSSGCHNTSYPALSLSIVVVEDLHCLPRCRLSVEKSLVLNEVYVSKTSHVSGILVLLFSCDRGRH